MSEIQESSKKSYEFMVSKSISLVEQEFLVSNIVDGIFENGYSPVRYTYVFWKEIIRAYTDLNVDEIEEDDMLDLIETESITLQIKETIRPIQLDNIENAVDELIAYRLNRSGFDDLCNHLIGVVNKYDEKMSSFLSSKKGKKTVSAFADKARGFIEKTLSTLIAAQKGQDDANDLKDVKE